MKSEWGKNTLYLWENQEKFAPLLDAWEIANRNNIFNDIGLKRLPFIANSYFHKPKHIYSWKTLIHAEKDPKPSKTASAATSTSLSHSIAILPQQKGAKHGFEAPAVMPHLFEERLSLHAVNH